MRREGAWTVVVPLVLASVEAGHALANVFVGDSAHEVFATAASGRGTLPLAAAALVALVLAALAARAHGAWVDAHRPAVTAAPFALLAPVAFVLLELSENAFRWGPLVDSGFLVGLALQLPAALLGYLVARALTRLADAVGARLGRRFAPARSERDRGRLATPLDQTLAPVPARGARRGRAPPAALLRLG